MLGSGTGAGVEGDEFSLGGVGVVKLRSKGLRGTGRIRVGPSSVILKIKDCITGYFGC
jgi:mRNA-degrading endonuclease RelE of RelBE toxin-antitoxin system